MIQINEPGPVNVRSLEESFASDAPNPFAPNIPAAPTPQQSSEPERPILGEEPIDPEQARLEAAHSQGETFGAQLVRGALDALLSPGAAAGMQLETAGKALTYAAQIGVPGELEQHVTPGKILEDFGRSLGRASTGRSALEATGALLGAAGVFGEQDATDIADTARIAVDEQERAWPLLSTGARIGGGLAFGLATGGIAGGAKTGAGGLAAIGAVEGGGAGAQAAYDVDAPLTEVWTSALMGGTLGAGLGAAPAAVGAAARKIRGSERLAKVFGGGSESLGSFGENRIASSLGFTKQHYKKYGPEKIAQVARAVDEAHLADGTPVFPKDVIAAARMDRAGIASNLAQAHDELGREIGALRSRASNWIDEQMPVLRPAPRDMAARIRAEVAEPLLKSASEAERSAGRYVMKTADNIDELGESMSLEQFVQQRSALGAETNFTMATPKPQTEAMRKVYGMINDDLAARFERAADGMGETSLYRPLNQKYHLYEVALEGLDNGVAMSQGNNMLGLSSNIVMAGTFAGDIATGGGFSALKALGAGIGHKLLTEKGPQVLAALANRFARTRVAVDVAQAGGKEAQDAMTQLLRAKKFIQETADEAGPNANVRAVAENTAQEAATQQLIKLAGGFDRANWAQAARAPSPLARVLYRTQILDAVSQDLAPTVGRTASMRPSFDFELDAGKIGRLTRDAQPTDAIAAVQAKVREIADSSPLVPAAPPSSTVGRAASPSLEIEGDVDDLARSVLGRDIDEATAADLIGHDPRLGDDIKFKIEEVEMNNGERGLGVTALPGDNEAFIDRAFYRNETGDLIARHSKFELPEDMRGAGIAKNVLRQEVEAYDRMGVKRITMRAEDDGIAVWPRMGFELEDHADFIDLKRQFLEYVDDLGLEKPRVKTLQDIAQWKDGDASGANFLKEEVGELDLAVDLQGKAGKRLREYLGVGKEPAAPTRAWSEQAGIRGERARPAAERILGRSINEDEVKSLSGMDRTDGDVDVFVQEQPDGSVRLESTARNAKGEALAYSDIYFRKSDDGRPVAHIEMVNVEDAGRGTGTRMLARQVQAFENLGISRVELQANSDGRYVWPRAGFEPQSVTPGNLNPENFKNFKREYHAWLMAEKGMSHEEALAIAKQPTMQDVATTEHGREFMLSDRNNNPEWAKLKVDLDGPSGDRLRQYLASKGLDTKGAPPAPAQGGRPDLESAIEALNTADAAEAMAIGHKIARQLAASGNATDARALQLALGDDLFGQAGRSYRQMTAPPAETLSALADPKQLREALRTLELRGQLSQQIAEEHRVALAAFEARKRLTGEAVPAEVRDEMRAIEKMWARAEENVTLDGTRLGRIVDALDNMTESKVAAKVPRVPEEQQVAATVQTGLKPVEQTLRRSTGRAIAAAALRSVPRALSQKERIAQYEQRLDTLAQVATQPDTEQQTAAIQEAPAGVREALVTAQSQKVQNLLRDMPKPRSTIQGTAYDSLSSEEIRRGNAMWEATMEPLSVFEDFARGSLDPDKVSYAWKQYPGLQQMAQLGVLDVLQSQMTAEERSRVPGNVLSQLDFMLGFKGGLQSTVSFEFSQRISGIHEQLQQQSATPAPPNKGLSLPTSKPTMTQRIAAQ